MHKTYQLYELLYKCLASMPKRDRYALGLKIEQQTLDFFELIMLASAKTGSRKLLILQKADLKLRMLQLFVRLAQDIKVLPVKRYIELEEKLLELGKMIGGWLKFLTSPENKRTSG
ncbi:MAG: diversity-generating retroelement protein Avd [Candidatus Vogelbacteria bacterium]|nr:diversity-generating retroelement protein Avd [Candidatus Vogelbacteria bacterium]